MLSSSRFQYHTGPIKRMAAPTQGHKQPTRFNTTLVQLKVLVVVVAITPKPEFQYHTGPIKSVTRKSVDCSSLPCFNTTLVQLKVLVVVVAITPKPEFQYHTGPIKRGSQIPEIPDPRSRFNTTLVQLKVSASKLQRILALGFNTTLVQLKGRLLSRAVLPADAFQYHTGPIKRSSNFPSANFFHHRFQYHTGPIKRHNPVLRGDHPEDVSIPHWSN